MTENSSEFETWYRRAHPRLGAALAAAFGDSDLAQEAADEAVARAFQKWSRVSAMSSPTGWLFVVGFNIARRQLRRRGVEQRVLRRERVEHQEPPAGELWSIVADLPERQRGAVVLRHVGQLREAEIGDVMGITRGTVSATLGAAYRSLRIELTESPDALEVVL